MVVRPLFARFFVDICKPNSRDPLKYWIWRTPDQDGAQVSRKQQFTPCSDTMEGFFNVTSVHGLYYLGSATRCVAAKIFWLLCITTSFSCAIAIIYLNVTGWSKNPSVVSSVEEVKVEVRLT